MYVINKQELRLGLVSASANALATIKSGVELNRTEAALLVVGLTTANKKSGNTHQVNSRSSGVNLLNKFVGIMFVLRIKCKS